MKHSVLFIFLVGIQVLLFVAADSLVNDDEEIEVNADDDDEDDDDVIDEMVDEIKGIKQSKRESYKSVQNVMHGSDNQSPTSQSQHIESSHSNKFAGQDLNEGKLKEDEKKYASSPKVSEGKKQDADRASKPSSIESVETKVPVKETKHKVDETLLFEEAELGEETLTDQVLRLGKRLQAERDNDKKAVKTEMEAKLVSIDLNEDLDKSIETKTSSEFVTDTNAKTGDLKDDNIMKDINKPVKKVKEKEGNEPHETKSHTDSEPNFDHKESTEGESITEIVKKQGQKVLDTETVTESLEEHDDLDFPNDPDDIAAEDEGEDDEILIFKPTEEKTKYEKDAQFENDELSHLTSDRKNNRPVKVKSKKDTTSKSNKMNIQGQSTRKYSKQEKLLVEESESEDGSLIDEVLKLGEKLKLRLDSKDASDKKDIYQKIEDEFDLIDKELQNLKADFPEMSSDTLLNKHASKDKYEKSKENVEKDEIDKGQRKVLENKKIGNEQNMQKDGDTKILESLQNIDINGKSSAVLAQIPAKVENTIRPKVDVIPSQTHGIQVSSTINGYTKVSADETSIRATPTSTATEHSLDSISQSPHLQITPTQTIEYSKSADPLAANGNKPKANEGVSDIIKSDGSNSIGDNTESSSSQSNFIKTAEEKTNNVVSKTKSLVQASSSEINMQDMHSATPSDNTVSSEAIFQSEHNAKAHVEETKKDSREQGILKMAPSSVEKTTIMETVINAQTSTHHTQLGKEGKRKIVRCICWEFCTYSLLYSLVAL